MLGRLILVSELDRCLLKAHSAIAQVKMGWWDCAFFVAFGERRGRGFELYKKIGKREGLAIKLSREQSPARTTTRSLECIAPRNGPACWCVAHAGPTKPECTLLAVAELMQRICTYYNCALEHLIVQEGCQKCTSREFHAVRFMEKRHTNSGLSMELTGKHSIYTHGGVVINR